MILKERHGLQRSPGMLRGVSEVHSSLLMVRITVAAGVSWGLCSSASLLAQMPHEPLFWPQGSKYTPSALQKLQDLLPYLRVSYCCWHLYGMRWDLVCHSTWTVKESSWFLYVSFMAKGCSPWFLSYLQGKWAVSLVNSSVLFKSVQLSLGQVVRIFLVVSGYQQSKTFPTFVALLLHLTLVTLWDPGRDSPRPGSRWHQCTAVTACTKTVIRKKNPHCSCCLQPFCLILAQKLIFSWSFFHSEPQIPAPSGVSTIQGSLWLVFLFPSSICHSIKSAQELGSRISSSLLLMPVADH